jgi:hypothetical protein
MQQFGLLKCVDVFKSHLSTFCIKVSGYNRLYQNALEAATRIRINQELVDQDPPTFMQ